MTNRKPLRLCIWNAQSIRNKMTEFYNFIITNKIHISLIPETWLKLNDSLSMQGYKIYRKDRTCTYPNNRNAGGGVAIAIRNDIPHSELPDVNTQVIESIGIEVGGLQFYAVYFPGSRLNSAKLAHFKNDISKLTANKKKYLLGGDLNSKHRFWNCTKANKAGSILYSEMISREFILLHPPSPTYFPPQANRSLPSTIDIAITNGRVNVSNVRTQNELSSDHLPVVLEVELNVKQQTAVSTERYYAKADWKLFKSVIDGKIDLTACNFQSKSNIDSAIRDFVTCLHEAESVAVPLRKVKSGSCVLDSDTQSLISLRNCLRRRSQRNASPYLKKLVNLLNRRIKRFVLKSKNEAWNLKLSSIPNNSKNLWKATKSISNKFCKIPPLKGNDNVLILSDAGKADLISKAFNSAHTVTFNDLSDPITESTVAGSTLFLNFLSPEINESDLPTPKEIKSIILKLKNRKSPGIDKISNVLLKKIPMKGIVFLMHIFRACFKLSYFPDEWKHAKVIPIPKPGKDLSSSDNYRPISLLNSLSKVLEKILVKRINDHLSTHDILSDDQFGFRNGHSTNHQLMRISKSIKKSLNKKESTGMLAYDVEKAFDSVWHKGLLYKMIKYKFPTYITKLVKSFLTKRSFHVSIDGTASKSHNIIAGVPQGSVLSPILYNIFMSDLAISFCEKCMFADDTSVQKSAKSPTKIVKSLSSASKQLSDFCKKWKIKLNGGKTQASYFTRRRAAKWFPSDEVSVLDCNIPWSHNLKTLGVTLDKSMTFREHIDLTVEKSLKHLAVLYPLLNRKSKLNIPNKMLIYKAIIRSTLLYACPVWGDCAASHINKLQLIQNKSLKLIYSLPSRHSTYDLHKIANLPTIKAQIDKISLRFRSKLPLSVNQLIRQLH